MAGFNFYSNPSFSGNDGFVNTAAPIKRKSLSDGENGRREQFTSGFGNATRQQIYDTLTHPQEFGQGSLDPALAAKIAGLTPSSSIQDWSNALDQGQAWWEAHSSQRDPIMDPILFSTLALGAAGAAGAFGGAGGLLSGGLGGAGAAAGAEGAGTAAGAAEGAGGLGAVGDFGPSLDAAWGAYEAPTEAAFGGLGDTAAATAGGTDIFGGHGVATGFTDTGTAGGALDTGYAGSGAVTGATGAVAPTSSLTDYLGGLLPSSAGDWLKLGTTVLGGLAGSQGQNSTTSHQLDPRLNGIVYGSGGIVPSAQGLLQSQLPQAQQAGQQMIDVGRGLLSQPIAGNGVGQVHLNAPNTPTNPYLSAQADDIARRTQQLLGQNNAAIQSNFVGYGGLGGSRQGIAQGTAAGQAADSLQGQLANLYGNAYNQDQNRALQQYQADQSFYTGQRGQDLTAAGVGQGLVQGGLNTGWIPINNATGAISPFTGFGSTTQQSGGGLQGALGGALGIANLGNQFGWWG